MASPYNQHTPQIFVNFFNEGQYKVQLDINVNTPQYNLQGSTSVFHNGQPRVYAITSQLTQSGQFSGEAFNIHRGHNDSNGLNTSSGSGSSFSTALNSPYTSPRKSP